MNVFPDRLREARKDKGWNQQHMSDLAGITQGMLSRYEKGETDPTLRIAQKMAVCLDVSLGFLTGTDYTGGDPLYRQFQKLTGQERELVKDFINLLKRVPRESEEDAPSSDVEKPGSITIEEAITREKIVNLEAALEGDLGRLSAAHSSLDREKVQEDIQDKMAPVESLSGKGWEETRIPLHALDRASLHARSFEDGSPTRWFIMYEGKPYESEILKDWFRGVFAFEWAKE